MHTLLEQAVNKDIHNTESQLQSVMEKMFVKTEAFNKCGAFVTLIE